jgi:hypothetical protein
MVLNRKKGDLTGDLGKLSKKGVLPGQQQRRQPAPSRVTRERRLATDPPGLLIWTLIGSALVLQLAFLIWLTQ